MIIFPRTTYKHYLVGCAAFIVLLLFSTYKCLYAEENSRSPDSSSSSSQPTGVPSNFDKAFSGTLDAYPIMMHLVRIWPTRLMGSYFYTKHGQVIPLKGEINDKGDFVLTEYSEVGQEVAVFRGRLSSLDEIQGTWNKIASKKLEDRRFQEEVHFSIFACSIIEVEGTGQVQRIVISRRILEYTGKEEVSQ